VNRRVMRAGSVSESSKAAARKTGGDFKTDSMRGRGLNDLPRRDIERQSSHQK